MNQTHVILDASAMQTWSKGDLSPDRTYAWGLARCLDLPINKNFLVICGLGVAGLGPL